MQLHKPEELCIMTFETAGAEKTGCDSITQEVSATMSELHEMIENTDTEIATLQKEIAALDLIVTVATDMRNTDHANFTA